jgi:hypothetical protein
MTRPSDKDILLGLVPKADPIGNVSVLRQLEERGWSSAKYWKVRDDLLAEGKLVRGKGKGGSIRRSAAEFEGAERPNNTAHERTAEAHLYEPILKVLRKDWIHEMQIEADQIHFEKTAAQGKKQTGGTWTRPDISGVSVRTFQHLPGKYVDVWTFEVKPVDNLDVTAVYEAAAHGARATRSCALLQVPENLNGRTQAIVDRCEREASRMRIGLVTFVRPDDFATWDILIDAPRLETAPELLEEFIAQLSDEAKRKLSRWR